MATRKKIVRKKSTRLRKRISKASEKYYVAVVCRDIVFDRDDVAQSQKSKGEWSCFVGSNLDAVVRKALRARLDWQRDDENNPYIILTGVLENLVEVPQHYDFVKLLRTSVTSTTT